MTNKPGNTLTLDMSSANQQLRDLLDLATDNQEKIDRIQSAELELLQSESLPELFDYLFNEHTMLFQLLSVNLQLIDSDFQVKRLLAETDDGRRFDKHLKLVTDSGTVNKLRQLGTQPILASFDAEDHEWLLTDACEDAQSVAILPLIRHNEVIGIATCTSVDKDRFQPELGTDLLKRLAAILAISIENAVNYHHLQYLGLTDALTGVRNRRFLDQRLSEEVLHAVHTHKPLSFLFVDIDYFKKINDTHGHQTGDKVLVKIAGLVYSHLRAADILTRYGGEEFAVLLKDLNMAEAEQIAQRIRTTVADAMISNDGKAIPVTVSIGVAELTQLAGDTGDANTLAYALTQAADTALYRAKEDGRNRVILASQ
jgi:diguanylate cyclase (GGDEF)-like protein